MAGKKYKDIEFITNKILVVLSVALVSGILLMVLSHMYQNVNSFMPAYITTKVLMFVSLAIAAFGVYRIVSDKKNEEKKHKYLTGELITVTGVIGAIGCYMIVYKNYTLAFKFLYAVIAAAAILYVIKQLYQRDFFVLAFIGAVDSIYLWRFASKLPGSIAVKIISIVIVLVIAVVLITAVISAKNGTVKFGKNKYRFFDAETEFPAFIITLAAILAVTVAALFIPFGWITFVAFGIVGIVFCAAVYYTVKLM